jgi:hypothetical protein
LRKSKWTVKCVFGFSVALFWIFFCPISTVRFMLEMREKSHRGLRVKWLVFLSHFVLNWNISTECNKLSQLKENPRTGTRVVTSR